MDPSIVPFQKLLADFPHPEIALYLPSCPVQLVVKHKDLDQSLNLVTLAPAYGVRAQPDFGVLNLQFLHELPFPENFLVGMPHHREALFHLYELISFPFGLFCLFNGHRGTAIFGERGVHTLTVKVKN